MSKTKARIRVLLVDDHAVVRDGLAMLIGSQRDMLLVGEACDGLEAAEKAGELAPDVVLLDLSMPRCGGVEAIAAVRCASPKSRILVLTMHDDQGYLRSVLAAGGAGYLVKSSAGQDLLHAIREVHAGRAYIKVTLGGDALRGVVAERAEAERAFETPLSEREQEVLVLVAHGYTHREIAERLGVSKKTVDTYRLRLMDKLRLHSRAESVRYAIEHNLLGELASNERA